MRLPFRKAWRAFPELDRFSDEQCAAYVRLARRERWLERLVVLVGSGTLCIGGFLVLSSLSWAQFLFGGLFGGSWTRFSFARLLGDNWVPSIVLSVIASVGAPHVVFLAVRDRWLRRAVRLYLRNAQCPMCRYLLLGLPVRDGAVRCPECGEPINLDSIGLTPADLIAPEVVAEAGSPA